VTQDLTVFNPSTEVLDIVNDADNLLQLANDHNVVDAASYSWADEDAAEIQKRIKALESYKEIAVRPVKTLYDERQQYFNNTLAVLKDAKNVIRSKQKQYKLRQDAVARETQKAMAQAAAEVGADAPVVVSAAPKGKTKYRDNWTFRVTDMAALVKAIAKNANANPDYLLLLQVNPSEARNIAKSLKQEQEYLPGLQIFNDPNPF
jgi:hypothetical protein